jgi:hypothetical protein
VEGKTAAGGQNEYLVPAAGSRQLNGLDLFQARDFFKEQLFHPLFKGHLRHGAAFAGPRESDFDYTVVYFNKFNVAPVALQHGTNLFQGYFHQFLRIAHGYPPNS